ncbi:MAG: hypothetical protein PUI49_04585 [Prevotellaceae bacterium]|nr:hypothetical protein [Prevotellaceae bacterium]
MDGLSTSAPYFHFQILEPEDEDPQLITTTTLRNSMSAMTNVSRWFQVFGKNKITKSTE